MNCPICNSLLQANGACGHSVDNKYHVMYTITRYGLDCITLTHTTVSSYNPVRTILMFDSLVFLTVERIEKLLLLKG